MLELEEGAVLELEKGAVLELLEDGETEEELLTEKEGGVVCEEGSSVKEGTSSPSVSCSSGAEEAASPSCPP